jgi:glycosyltransferase involved in cell wall biosynthesis
MKLLILTQYFPPETGAPQNRLYDLAIRLKDRGVQVTILTAMPNYPKMEIFEGYRQKKYVYEEMDGLAIHRTSIYVTKSKRIVSRLRNYFSFVYSSWKHGKKLGAFDYLLCESPPLFLGYSAIRLSKKLNARLIFNVSDLWPESAEKLGLVTNRVLLNMAYRLEAKCYRKSWLVTGQTQGIVKSIQQRFPQKRTIWLPNGVDPEAFQPNATHQGEFRRKYRIGDSDTVLFYGGILGHAQGLDTIIRAASKLQSEKALKFVLMGSGPLKDELIALSKSLQLQNVIFADPVDRKMMNAIIAEIDFGIIPLKNIPLFLGAIPSKIFELLAMERPILLGVEGEARDLFVTEAKSGWSFEPENADDLAATILRVLSDPSEIKARGKNGRAYVSAKFNRKKIADDFYDVLVRGDQS